MKKILLLSSLVASTLLFANDKPPRISALMQYSNLLVESPSQKYTDIKNSDSDFKVGADIFLSDSYNYVNVPLSYVYDNKVGVSVYIPYVDTDLGSGIGDTTFEFSFNVGSFDKEIEQENNIFGIRYTHASGDEKKALGVGASSVGIFWDTNAVLDEWTLYGSLLWTFYIDDVTLPSGIEYTPGSEDIFWIGASHKCLLSDKINTTGKLNWQYQTEDETVTGYRINGTGYNMVDFTIEWESDKLIKNAPLRAGVKIPIWDSNVVDNEFMFFVGIGGLF